MKEKEKLFEAIRELNLYVNQAIEIYKPEVENIINNNVSDSTKIEELLEKLLDFSGYEEGLILFRKLCNYYYKINPIVTAEYVMIYRDLYDEDYENERRKNWLKDKNILFMAFKDNSSSELVKAIKNSPNINKLYLDNDFEKCKEEFINVLNNNKYDYIFAFGRKPNCKQLFIEYHAINTKDLSFEELETNFDDIDCFLELLDKNDIKYKNSDNAGVFLCNYIYFSGLNYIESNKRNDKMVFIHVPDMKNFLQYKEFLRILNNAI